MNEAHIPVRSPIMGNRKTGDLSQRKAPGNQSQAGGGRYDVDEAIQAEKKEGTQKALRRASAKKGEEIYINPEKPDIIGRGYN